MRIGLILLSALVVFAFVGEASAAQKEEAQERLGEWYATEEECIGAHGQWAMCELGPGGWHTDPNIAWIRDDLVAVSDKFIILGRAATWVRGSGNNFLRVPLACLGSREAALQLWNFQETFYKPLNQVAARPSKGYFAHKLLSHQNLSRNWVHMEATNLLFQIVMRHSSLLSS